MSENTYESTTLEQLLNELIDDGANIVTISDDWPDVGLVCFNAHGIPLENFTELRQKYDSIDTVSLDDEQKQCIVELDAYGPTSYGKELLYSDEPVDGFGQTGSVSPDEGIQNYLRNVVN